MEHLLSGAVAVAGDVVTRPPAPPLSPAEAEVVARFDAAPPVYWPALSEPTRHGMCEHGCCPDAVCAWVGRCHLDCEVAS